MRDERKWDHDIANFLMTGIPGVQESRLLRLWRDDGEKADRAFGWHWISRCLLQHVVMFAELS